MPDLHNSFANLSVMESVPLGVDPVAFLRASSPLPLRAEELLDDTVTEIALERLNLVSYLYGAGLRTNLPDWLGVLNMKWQKRSRVGRPKVGMIPDVTVRDGDSKLDLDLDTLPVYCWTEKFTIHPRLFAEWELAVRRGLVNASLDTTMVADHLLELNRAIELATIEGPMDESGNPFSVNGVTVTGLIDAPNVIEYENNRKWTDAAKTGPMIYSDVSKAIDKAQSLHHYGDYILAVGTKYDRVLDGDYVTTMANTKTIRQRLLEIRTLKDIVAVDMLPEDTTLLIEPKKQNLDMIVGQMPTWFSWMEGPTALAIRRYAFIACVFLRIREDYDGQNGVVVGKPTA